MNIIPKISTVAAQPGRHVELLPVERVAASGEFGRRVVNANSQAYKLLMAAGLTPPAEGETFDVHELDAKLLAAGMETSQRMALKAHLRDMRLLRPGKPVDMTRR